MRFSTLDQWLRWQETLHPAEIELGLERVSQVYTALCPEALPFTVVTVAGTNGKGSSIAALEAVLLAAGYHVGTYTSPHLLRYNERVRLDGVEIDDQSLIDAFEQVDEARGQTSLTYFEFGTLAALRIFADRQLQIVLLEVGLGGRLDAVNIIDPDVALITAIGLDHTAWLGKDRETIATEKAGIMRTGRPVVCSDSQPPASIAGRARAVGASLYQLGRDYAFRHHPEGWDWWRLIEPRQEYRDLPRPSPGGEYQFRNLAGALMVLSLLQERFPVTREQVFTGLKRWHLPGRLQLLPGEVPILLDVAHNPDGVAELARALAGEPVTGRTWAIVGMMADKDIHAALAPLLPLVSGWIAVDLEVPRAASSKRIAAILRELGATAVSEAAAVGKALALAREWASKGDRIVVFGSFYTVAEVLPQPL